MEAAPAAGRGGSLPVPSSSQLQRREWRAVPDNCFRSNGNEMPEHVKLGPSDERTIYEVQEGTGPLDVDFCSITIDCVGASDDVVQQRLHGISRQREELQRMEIELRAQVIARTEILEMQKNFDARIKEHVNAASKLKEQLHEREQCIRGLEMKMEEKERELRAVKIDNEAAWAKEDLLREQNKELATYRIEHDNLEAERVQHLKQIHEIQERIQEKRNQYLELEEQHRVAQETILFKDEQLREAQAWVARAQEMEAFHSSTNQRFQAELRDRTEQFNQYLIALQQQFAEVDRHHRQAIQQLQLELAQVREQHGVHNDDSQMAHTSSKDSSSYVENKGSQVENDGSTTNCGPTVVTNGDSGASFLSAATSSAKVPGLPVVPSSVLGLGAFLPPSQVIAPHPIIHPQGTQPVAPANSHGPQNHMGYYQPVPTVSSQQHWGNQQAVSDIPQMPNQGQQSSQVGQNPLKLDAHYGYEISAEQQAINPVYLESFKSQGQGSETIASGSDGNVKDINGKELESNENIYVPCASEETTHEDSDFRQSLGSDMSEMSSKPKINSEASTSGVSQLQGQVNASEAKAASDMALTVTCQSVNSIDGPECNTNAVTVHELPVSTMQETTSLTSRKAPELILLDESALLACLVRVIPAGTIGGIRISSTLPNRLGKMLAPLHWHDYRKQYGKLDDFVSRHPELFVIEGDFIHLREGAQEIISATTAVAKVAAAAAAFKPYSSMLPSVAVTPVAQTQRLRKNSSAELKSGNSGVPPHNLSQISTHSQQQNVTSSILSYGISDLKIGKSKVHQDAQSGHQPGHATAKKELTKDRTAFSFSQNKRSSNGRLGVGTNIREGSPMLG